MADICDSCAFEYACSSAYFHPTGRNVCSDYRTMQKEEAIEAWNRRVENV